MVTDCNLSESQSQVKSSSRVFFPPFFFPPEGKRLRRNTNYDCFTCNGVNRVGLVSFNQLNLKYDRFMFKITVRFHIVSPVGRTDTGSFSNNSNRKSSHQCPAVKLIMTATVQSPASTHHDISSIENWGQVLHQFLHGPHHDDEALLLHVNRGSFVILRDEGEDDVKSFPENEVGPNLLNLQGTILNNNDYNQINIFIDKTLRLPQV